MPELPEVETVARDLRALVVGARIVSASVAWERTVRGVPAGELSDRVAGRTIEAVGRRAKLVVIELSGGAALTVHLKMTGQLFVVEPRGFGGGAAGAGGGGALPPDPYVRVTLGLEDGREIRFRDVRKFGRIGFYERDTATGELVEGPGGALLFAGHGPEPLDDAFTLRVFRERLRARRGRLKSLLLDQSFVAGVGNIYADEALWRTRLHPLRSAASLRPADERRLYRAIRAILAEAIERRGSSIDDYTAPEGDGSMQERLDVYQRTGQPCARCGRPVRRVVLGARGTHFCSWCQRLPAADRPGARRILATMTGGLPARTGRRWVDLVTDGTLGATPVEIERNEEARRERDRRERTSRAAATRRARARQAVGSR